MLNFLYTFPAKCISGNCDLPCHGGGRLCLCDLENCCIGAGCAVMCWPAADKSAAHVPPCAVPQAACRCPTRATTAAGSAPATAATTTRRAARARGPRPTTWRCPPTSSWTRGTSWSARRAPVACGGATLGGNGATLGMEIKLKGVPPREGLLCPCIESAYYPAFPPVTVCASREGLHTLGGSTRTGLRICC